MDDYLYYTTNKMNSHSILHKYNFTWKSKFQRFYSSMNTTSILIIVFKTEKT